MGVMYALENWDPCVFFYLLCDTNPSPGSWKVRKCAGYAGKDLLALLSKSIGKFKPRTSQRYAVIRSRRLVHTEETTSYMAKKDSRRSPMILVVGPILIFTFALGTWQLQRLQWKINLIQMNQKKNQSATQFAFQGE